MKKHFFLKSFALIAVLFSAMTISAASGVDWSAFDFIGDGAGGGAYANKYKVQTVDGLSVVNIQKPEFADEAGIYLTVPAGISNCTVNGAIQGAGMVLYLSSLTAKETEVTITHGTGSCTFWVYYADGTEGGGEELPDTEAPTLISVELFGAAQNFVLLSPNATDNKGVTSYLITPNGGAEKEVTLDNAGKIKIEGLTLDKSYTYSVKAKDAAGNVSAAKEITFSTLDRIFCEEEILPNVQFTTNQKLTFTAKKVSNTETLFTLTSSTSTLTKMFNVNLTNAGSGVLPAGYVWKDDWTLTDNTLSKTVTWETYPTNPITIAITANRTPGAGESNLIGLSYSMDISNTCGEEPTPEPEETIIAGTYIAPNWTVDPTSSATYDANTGTITVDIKNALSSQWQGQVKVKHDVAFSADKQYTLSCKFHATAAVNGVTIKMDDNQDAPVVLENATVNLPANQDYVYTSAPSNGVVGNNQILVFDFGWAPVCQITISDIVIQEVEPTQPEEPGESGAIDWSSVEWVAGSDNKYKVYHECLSNVINVQKPGWAAENGIYVTTPGAITDCTVNGAIDGAGMVLYLSSFTAKETEVTINYAGGSCTFWVYYADGTEGGGEGGTPTEIYDTNFALTANGATAEATSGDPALALDNNTGSRWESAHSDPQTFIIDLGQERIFNTLEIVWEGAYAKTFTVSTSSDKTAWTPVWNVTGQELAGFPYTQTQTIDKTTARYVKFEGTERGTIYGYSFYEFRVYLAGVSTLTSLEAKAESAITKVGATNTITITAKDQNGQAMANAGEVTYTITPADAGTITGDVYTPAKIGAASIVASIGEVAAAAFEVVAYDGENVAFSADRINANKVIAQSGLTDGTSFDAWYAVDGNDGSVWQGSLTNGTAGDEAARTFDSWFVVDFGAYYDINLVSIKFEGACAQDYHVDFSADNANWNVAYNHVGNNGINAHTKYIYGSDLQNTTKVRYARFYSTKAATEWGMKVFELKVYGLPFVASGDTEKPVMGTATLVSKTHNTAVISVDATDNDEVVGYHIVDNANSYNQTLAPTDGKITLVDLTPNTSYALTISARDLAGNESENAATVSFTTDVYNLKPTAAPTAPTHDASKVQSVYCDVYGGTFSATEGWGQSTQFEELNFDGNYVRYYTNFNYLGWQTATPINAYAMEKLHLDIWTSDNATLDIVPIYGGPGLTTDDGQIKKVTLIGQQWNSIEFDLATDFPNLNISSIFQFKFFNPSGAAIFAFDNVYFYRESETGDVTPPTNLTATAVPSFTTAVINCKATDESGNITYKVYLGTEFKGSASANSGETAAITVTNLQTGQEFTMTVIATDAHGNESDETVDVTFTTLSYPAPAPTPQYPVANVFSIYSNAYTTTVNRAFGWGWGASTVEAEVELAAGDNALQYTTCNYAGWEFNGNTSIGNLKEYPYLHMDIYVEAAGSIQFSPIWGSEALKEYTLQAGWNAINIDLVAEFKGINLANIIQMKWAAMPANCFIDNVYFYTPVEINDDVDGLTGKLAQYTSPVDVVLGRAFTDEYWQTISLPFDLNATQVLDIFGNDVEVLQFAKATESYDKAMELGFLPVNAIQAATPYLIKPSKKVGKGTVVRNVTINTTPNAVKVDNVTMHPLLDKMAYDYTTAPVVLFFLGSDSYLHYQANNNTILGLRAYFTFDGVTSIAQAQQVRARVIQGENKETGFDQIATPEDKPSKFIENGQLVIIYNGQKYNIHGLKISE